MNPNDSNTPTKQPSGFSPFQFTNPSNPSFSQNPFSQFSQANPNFPQIPSFPQNPSFQANPNINQQHFNFQQHFTPNPTSPNVDPAYHAYAQFIANNPNLAFGASQPESVPETQPDPKAGSSQKTAKAKKKKGKAVDVDTEPPVKQKKMHWSTEENEKLFIAWMERSEDTVVDSDGFWASVYATFIKLMDKDATYRDINGVSSHWRDLNRQIQLYHAIYNRVKSDWGSGKNDTDIQARVNQEYKIKGDGKTEFHYHTCWRLVQNHPKWKEVKTTGHALRYLEAQQKKKSKTTSTSSPSTPSDANHIDLDLNDDPFEDAINLGDDYSELPRPPGTKKSRAATSSSKSKSVADVESHATSKLTEVIKEHIQENRLSREQLKCNADVQSSLVRQMNMRDMRMRIAHLREIGREDKAKKLEDKLGDLIEEFHEL